MTIRVRFAPSPTGYLHVGGARTALFNWLFARAHDDGVFLLRIEDTDPERSTEEHVRAILDGLEWLGLGWDGNVHYQSDGFDRHRAQAHELLERGLAYRDWAEPGGDPVTDGSPDEPHAIRFRVPDEGATVWEDLVHGEVRFENRDLEDLVILRRDGTPTYNFAVVSDDAEMEVTHVIRGDDHLSNTPKQILLYEAMGRAVPTFAHTPMILGPDGKRLSKRHGATAVEAYEEEGILPGAMVNFLALLGWNPGGEQEVMTVEELIDAFDMDRVLKKSAVFDREKLEWLNGQHMARTPAAELAPDVRRRLLEEGGVAEEVLEAQGQDWLESLVELLKVRHRTVAEVAGKARVYLVDPVELDPAAVEKRWGGDPDTTADHLQRLWTRLSRTEWEPGALEEALRGLADELDVGAGKLIHPLRVALVGESASPGIFQTLVHVGRERALGRIEGAVELIRTGAAFTHESSGSPE